MQHETTVIISIVVQFFLLGIMIASGIWVAYDAKKQGRAASEYLIWGLFAGAFIFLGPIVYILWRNYVYKKEDEN